MDLTEILALETLDEDRFEATPPGDQPLYGGCTAAMGLAAALRTAPETMSPKSLRTLFLRAGRWGVPTELVVERWSDGRTFAVRQVGVHQAGRLIAAVTATFHSPAAGVDWQASPPIPPVPGPADSTPEPLSLPDPIFELRTVNEPPPTVVSGSTHPFWTRPATSLGDDPAWGALALTFMSDYVVVFSTLRATVDLGEVPGLRTLSHDLWFHRPTAPDQWLRYDAAPISLSDGRSMLRGEIVTEAGVLVASFAQEAVLPS